MAKQSLIKRLFSLFTAAAVAVSLTACNKNETENFKLSFTSVNTRGNTNGNIANMGLGAQQGNCIIFTDMGAGGKLKVSHSNGEYCFTIMEDLNDIFACINLVGYELSYISSIYGDINTVDLNDMTAGSLLMNSSYCLQSIGNEYYFIDESSDGCIYRLSEKLDEVEKIGTHAAYVKDTSNENNHASFSIDGNYLYYVAADDGFHIYRVDLSSNEEIRLGDASASMLIVQDGKILFVDSDDRMLYEIDGAFNTHCLTSCKVGTFNFDREFIYYTDASKSAKPVMRMELNGKNPKEFCREADTMYINLFDESVMLYCVSADGSDARTVFAHKQDGKIYTPQ